MTFKPKTISINMLLSISVFASSMSLAADELTRTGQFVEHNVEAYQLLQQLTNLPTADHLVVYENKGIALEDKQGKTLSMLKGSYSSLDHRNTDQGLLVATVDTQNQQALISVFNQTSRSWNDTIRLPKPDFKIEGVCLYQNSTNNEFVFLIGEEGHAQQWLIGDSHHVLDNPMMIRSLSTPPNSEFCRVDDARSLLFINEENVGVWAYDAHPEADLTRQAIALTQPFGEIKESVLGMQLIPNGLVLIDEVAKDLHVYLESQNQWQHQAVYPLTTLQSPKDLSVRVNGTSLDISVLHDVGQVSYSLPWSHKASLTAPDYAYVMPEVETENVPSLGDAADDPAIWVNQTNPADSLVLATDKQGGLAVYDMAGNSKQYLPVGRINNVDIRSGFEFNNKRIDLAVASHRDHNALDVFSIDPLTGFVIELGEVATDLDDIYGLCMYKNRQGDIYTIVNDKDGRFQQYEMGTQQGQIHAKLVREFSEASQPEGCVADDANDRLFMGEENVAVWTIDARADAETTMQKVMSVGKDLKADIEGISLYRGQDASYLVISSQGNDSYSILEALPPYRYLGSFKIGINSQLGIDGVSETDGLDVTSANLGGPFAQGMLVVQDGRNRMPEQNQNFKYIAWSSIADTLNLNNHKEH